jgi:alkaline phosphatase D
MHRRTFLQALVATAGASLLDTGCSDEPVAAPPRETVDGAAFFPQGIASGDPRSTSVILWARVDDPEVKGDLVLELQVARDEAFEDLVTLDGKTTLEVKAVQGERRREGALPADGRHLQALGHDPVQVGLGSVIS